MIKPPSAQRTSLQVPRKVLIIAHDVVVTTAAFPAAMLLRDNFALSSHHLEPTVNGTLLIFLIATLVFSGFGLHRSMWSHASLNDLRAAARALTIILVLSIPAMFLLDRLEGVPRAVPIIFWCVAMVGLSASRILYRSYCCDRHSSRSRRSSASEQRVLVVGNPEDALLVIHTLAGMAAATVRVVGIVSDRIFAGRTLAGVPVLGDLGNFPEVLGALEIGGVPPTRIIVADPHADLCTRAFQQLIKLADASEIQVDRSPNLWDFRTDLEQQSAQPSFCQGIVGAGGYHRIKRLYEGFAAGLALLFVAPLIGLVAIATVVSVGSPVLFNQVRAGRKMRGFALRKFRTMGDPLGADGRMLSDQERMTRVGALLRRSKLDELPQLWNVFMGHMSLIGPRPLLPRDLPIDDHVTLHERYSVRPGLTGWAQVNGGQRLTAEQKMTLDLYYIRHASLFFDLKILLLTMGMIVRGEKINQHEIERAKTALVVA